VSDYKPTADPGYRVHYNVNPELRAFNDLDSNENPTGGVVVGTGLNIKWQDGPRGPVTADQEVGPDGLLPPNGAFVEDVLWAALQRLEFFNESKYRDRANSIAITKIEEALQALKNRQLERSHRGVEGKHEV
jgi:hypothetical protein